MPHAIDSSAIYTGYNDLNEKLQNLLAKGIQLNSAAQEFKKGPIR